MRIIFVLCPTVLEELRASLFPCGVLWHRPRGKKRWVRFGEFPSVAEAADVLFAEQDRGTTGDWQALPVGRRPCDEEPDDGNTITLTHVTPIARNP